MAETLFITTKIEHYSNWGPYKTMELSIDFESIRSSINSEYKGKFIAEGEPSFSVTETHYFVTFKVRNANDEDTNKDGPLPIGYSATQLKI
ncbi:hypothetical protein [Fluviicola sp.]|uniref:hypothetical protein n=1 Tax=Fluviicola sp. TaxID=1917219 RepID=UPI00260293C9|nr:hypothetical protein [Fluviicola sp.]